MYRVRNFDTLMLASAVALVGMGLALIYSANLVSFGPEITLSHPVTKQFIFLIIGGLFSLLLAGIDYRTLGHFSLPMYVIALGALMFVLVLGHAEYGSRRWISFAGTLWQPSEVAKLVTIIVLAKYLSDRRGKTADTITFFTSLAIAAIPAGLVFIEPDLGTAVVFGAIWLSLILMSGVKKRHLIILSGFLLALLPFAVALALNDYQRDRVSLFLDPGKEPLERGFNILQAEISIGSGGLLGQGLTHGNQTQLSYLQTKSTDYIFSVLGEELGFIGAMLLFGLYILFLFRGIRIAAMARDTFGRLVATGIVVMVMSQVFINVGVNIRLFPVTGIPLPFISQGGTSLLSIFLGIGILQSIAVRGRTSGSPLTTFEDRYS